MGYRLLLLDIDGTLRPGSSPVIPRENVEAVTAIQRIGVKVAIASGRSRTAISDAMLNGLAPDFWLCAAGAQILDRDGRELYAHRMPARQVKLLMDWFEAHGYPLFQNCSDGSYIHAAPEELPAITASFTMRSDFRADPAGDHYQTEVPYTCFGRFPEAEEADFHRDDPDSGLKFYFYRGKFCDIMQEGVSKASGLDRLLEHTGFDREECVFVGDGDNDVELMEHAGRSFCVAGGSPKARAAAKELCPPAEEFGVAVVCRKLWPQAFHETADLEAAKMKLDLTEATLIPVNTVMDFPEPGVVRAVKTKTQPDENTYLKVRDTDFHNGVIEVDVRGGLLPDAPEYARGFIGIVFRANASDSEFESFYIRPTNGRDCADPVRKAHGCQYFSYPGYTFSYFREFGITAYEGAVDTIALDQWSHIKAVIREDEGLFYVDGHLVLEVHGFKHGRDARGTVGLYVDIGTDGYFKNLVIQPDD